MLTGNGGASKSINGIDLRVVGTPPRQYRVVGYIEDTRLGGPIPMAMRNPQLAATVRKQGGDALLLSSDNVAEKDQAHVVLIHKPDYLQSVQFRDEANYMQTVSF